MPAIEAPRQRREAQMMFDESVRAYEAQEAERKRVAEAELAARQAAEQRRVQELTAQRAAEQAEKRRRYEERLAHDAQLLAQAEKLQAEEQSAASESQEQRAKEHYVRPEGDRPVLSDFEERRQAKERRAKEQMEHGLWRFEQRVSAARVSLVGQEVRSKLWLLNNFSALLEPVHYICNIEGAVCIYMSEAGVVLDVEHWVGDESSVPLPPETITANALKLGAAAIALAHNHPDDRPSPSDQDVWHAAGLVESLACVQVRLLEDYVWCHDQFKSVLNTRRFKQLAGPID